MKKFLPAILILTAALTSFANAQTLTYQDLTARGEVGIDTGYSPKSLESMVGYSALIVKGRYGEFLGSKTFFGYFQGEDESLESFAARRGMSERLAEEFSSLLSEYEIIVEEVLLGQVDSNTLVLRAGGALPGYEKLTGSDKDRIFFLRMNPDNRTYGALGEAGILTAQEGVYGYNAFVLRPGNPRIPSFVVKPLEFMPSMAVEDFDAALRAEILKATAP